MICRAICFSCSFCMRGCDFLPSRPRYLLIIDPKLRNCFAWFGRSDMFMGRCREVCRGISNEACGSCSDCWNYMKCCRKGSLQRVLEQAPSLTEEGQGGPWGLWPFVLEWTDMWYMLLSYTWRCRWFRGCGVELGTLLAFGSGVWLFGVYIKSEWSRLTLSV